MSEVINDQVVEQTSEECVHDENKPVSGVATQIECVFYRKETVDTIIALLNNISVKGTENVSALAKVNEIIVNSGTVLPVTVQ